MLPVIRLFGVSAQTYYLCAALAGLAGFVLSASALRRLGLGRWSVVLPLLVLALAVSGARGLNYLTNPEAYREGFSVWTLRYTKLSLMGGLAAGGTGIFLSCLLLRRSPGRVMDAFVLPAAVGIVLLKLGCFCNGCCFGKPTDGPFGVVFPANELRYRFLEALPLLRGTSPRVHPTQLYEIAGALAALAVALAFGRRFGHGGRTALFGGLFALARWLVLPLRALPYTDAVIHAAYPALYGASAALAAAVLAFLRLRNNKDRPAAEETGPYAGRTG